MAKLIFESDLLELAAFLAKEQELYLPIIKNPNSAFSQCTFEKYSASIIPNFNYSVSVLPPKEFFLPPTAEIFSFKNDKISPVAGVKKIIFGVNLNDLEGIAKLRKLFSEPINDKPFEIQASQVAVVAIDRFSPPKNINFDLYLMKINKELYAGFAGSKKGQQILRNPLFKDGTAKIPTVRKIESNILQHPKLSEIIKKSKNHPIWEELAEKCLGCGICSYVCPLCYCFETEDKIEFGTEASPSGTRCRSWDSCLLQSFTATKKEESERALKDRIYNWYYHKFVRMPEEVGFQGCVDCNRCVIYCPAKINYHQVLSTLIKDSEKKNA